MADIALGIHGGCGTMAYRLQGQDQWAESREHLAQALRAGWAILRRGGSALDAVQAAVVRLEDSAHFNAGHGAALTEDGEHDLDASIMDGATLAAGAVCTVRRVRNPIQAARALLESGHAVLLAGEAADRFAQSRGLEMVEQAYFTTQQRLDALRTLRERMASGVILAATEAEKHGTVGAVARDAAGHLAAATSTGGFNNKPAGRVGDSPIIGAGTYAQDGVCAVSCTGQGEVFIRCVAAHELAARIRYAGQDLATAAQALVFETLSQHQIGAGLVALGERGDPVAPYNTLGMYRGWIGAAGRVLVGTHQDLLDLGPA